MFVGRHLGKVIPADDSTEVRGDSAQRRAGQMGGRGGCLTEDDRRSAESAILGLLLNFDAGSIWAVDELVRQLSSPRLDVLDGLAELEAAGLIHQLGDFVFASRAASSFDRLEL
jgi:hypothetical protein